MKILLASSSPRRRDLLRVLGYDMKVINPLVDEIGPEAGKSPEVIVKTNAAMKAKKVYEDYGLSPGTVIVGADTVVSLKDRVLLKPNNNDEAISMLKSLSAQKHEVITGYHVVGEKKELSGSVVSTVFMRELPVDEIMSYVDTNEGKDKAGAYGIQGAGASLVHTISGSITNIIGLPVEEVLRDAKKLIS